LITVLPLLALLAVSCGEITFPGRLETPLL